LVSPVAYTRWSKVPGTQSSLTLACPWLADVFGSALRPALVEVNHMWKRDEAVKPPTPPAPAAPATAVPAAPAVSATNYETRPVGGKDVVHIGKSVVIKGELNGSEDLTIEGHVEGKIELKDHVLTIGSNGRIRASVFAKSVIVLGEVVGNVTGTEKVDIRDNGSVDGDIVSPRVAIAEGAHFRGSVDMKRNPTQAAPAKSEPKVEAAKPPAGSAPVANPAGTQKVGA
jgi:cytoskeletal protein CcmA (bactofilin family)